MDEQRTELLIHVVTYDSGLRWWEVVQDGRRIVATGHAQTTTEANDRAGRAIGEWLENPRWWTLS